MANKIEQAQAQVREAESRLNNAKRLLDEALREKIEYPPEPLSDYIAFTVTFAIPGKNYRYTAVRVGGMGGQWYTSGGDMFNDWQSLVEWIKRNNVIVQSTVVELSSAGRSVRIPT